MVVGGGLSAQNMVPAEACSVAAELGIEGPCFDVNSACATAAVQLSLLSRLITTEGPDFVLVVNPENNTRLIDFNDRAGQPSCLAMGHLHGRVNTGTIESCDPVPATTVGPG